MTAPDQQETVDEWPTPNDLQTIEKFYSHWIVLPTKKVNYKEPECSYRECQRTDWNMIQRKNANGHNSWCLRTGKATGITVVDVDVNVWSAPMILYSTSISI